MLRLLVAIIFITHSSLSLADTVKCTIDVQDVNVGSKVTVEHNFNFKPGAAAQRKHFDLSGSPYTCTLAFFDPSTGTMLSCANKKDLEHTFVQSDRSAITENSTKNNLSFRDGSTFFTLSAAYK
jgi:hypothetical protein